MVINDKTSSYIKFWFPKVSLKRVFSPNVRESKTILDSGFQIPDSKYWTSDTLSVELGFQILIVGGIHKQNFPGLWNPDSLSLKKKSVWRLWRKIFYAYIPCGLLDCRVLLASRTISSSSSPSSSKPPSSSPAVSPRPWSPACMFLRVASDSYRISTTKTDILVPFRIQKPLTFKMKLSAKFAFSLALKQRLWATWKWPIA